MRREAAAIRRRHVATHGDELLQRADLRHDELIEVRGKDAEKSQAGCQRRPRILGELEDACVELEPRQFGIEKLLGRQAGWILRLFRERRHTELGQRDTARARHVVRNRWLGRSRRITEWRARPFGNQRGASRDRQGGERSGVPQHRRADARHQIGGGEPLQCLTVARVPVQTPRGPDLEGNAIARSRDHTEESQLSFPTPHELTQRRAARRFTAPLVNGEAQLGAGAAQSHAAVLDGDERHFPFAAQLPADPFGFDGVECRHGALQGIVARGPQ